MPDTEPSPSAAQPVLQVQHLHFAYPGAAPLFTGWNLALPAGVTLLHGDIGAGKTSLLRLLAGELQPQRGEIRLHGPLYSPVDSRLLGADPVADRRDICWFDPRDEAHDQLTAAGLMAALAERHPGLDEAAWREHLDGFGLQPHLAKPFYALSTGSRRKAGLAAALASRCALTLLDDPTAGLDTPSLAWLADTLEQLADAAADPATPARALLLVAHPALEGLAGVHDLVLPAQPAR